MYSTIRASIICFAPVVLAMALVAPAAAQSPETIAAAALQAAPVWDGHNDVPIQLRARRGNVLAGFDFTNTHAEPGFRGEAQPSAMQTDLPRLRAGRVGAQFWSVFVSTDLDEPRAVQATLEQIDVTRRLIAAYPRDLELALTADDVARIMQQGRIASLLGMEGGHAIGSSLGVLRQMHALGVRYLTLTHTAHTAWADSANPPPLHDGLTPFGEMVLREMMRIGMLVDLSHVSPATMHDALDVAAGEPGGGAPVIFSHSGTRALVDHARNVPDDVLARLPGNGGIVMVAAMPAYLDEAVRLHVAARLGEQARLASLWLGQPREAAQALAAWDAANPAPLATVADMADQIDHIRDIAGIDHIGIGGDYDGMPSGPAGMEDVAGYPALFTELARRGYRQDELERISSRNMLRVLRAAEAHAERMADQPAHETPAR